MPKLFGTFIIIFLCGSYSTAQTLSDIFWESNAYPENFTQYHRQSKIQYEDIFQRCFDTLFRDFSKYRREELKECEQRPYWDEYLLCIEEDIAVLMLSWLKSIDRTLYEHVPWEETIYGSIMIEAKKSLSHRSWIDHIRSLHSSIEEQLKPWNYFGCTPVW
ncbi:MAG: hypothetical protein IH852_04395 [Bacteroidetes bacterium]|nr:hypothetical protein [Bacteroidota bacterium]